MIRHGVLAWVFLLGLSAASDGPAGPPEGERSASAPAIEAAVPLHERALRAVLTIHNWKLTEAVGLSEEQAAQLFPRFREAFQIRWQSERRRGHLLRRLEKMVDVAPQEGERLAQLLSQWGENEARLRASQDELQGALKRVLTPMQLVKYLLFQERFQGDLVRVLNEQRGQQPPRRVEQKRATER